MGGGVADKGGGANDNDKIVLDIISAVEKRLPEIFDERKAHQDSFKVMEVTTLLFVILLSFYTLNRGVQLPH